jgi:hypothetical protein
LRGRGGNPLDAQVVQDAADLGRGGAALQLLGERERGAGLAVEDPMAVGVGGAGHAIAAEELAEEQEIAVGILLQAKDAAEDLPRGVVDRGMEDEARPPVFEPRVVTAVHLDQQAGLRHGLAPAAMPRGPAGARAANAGGAEDPLHGPAGEVQTLALGEQLGELVIIHPAIPGTDEREDAGPDRRREPAGRRPAAITVGEGGHALLTQAREEAAEVPHREAEQPRREPHLEGPLLDPTEQMRTLVLLLRQRNRLPDHGPRVTDSLAC